ncbi:hypothetical protein J3A83DRAFT_4213259 [Scleroderma citrinum]
MAPGEAEAELAYFHSHGLIDAVVTLFSDVLLFGATSVIRSIQSSSEYGDVKVYTSDALQHSPFLKWEDLLLMVLMNGAGYDFGLPNCNVDISHRLARYGLGRSLVQAVANQKFVDFMSFITKWCKDLCWVLERDPEHHLGWRYYELACVIEEECTEFPNPAILAAYLSPLTSWSSGGHPPVSIVTSHQPDLTALAVFCLQCLGWSMDSLRPRLMDAHASAIIRALLQIPGNVNSQVLQDHLQVMNYSPIGVDIDMSSCDMEVPTTVLEFSRPDLVQSPTSSPASQSELEGGDRDNMMVDLTADTTCFDTGIIDLTAGTHPRRSRFVG